MIKLDKVGEWELAQKILNDVGNELRPIIDKALRAEGQYLVGQIKKRLRDGPFQPLADTTLTLRKLKGFKGTKPLIRSGDMRNSVVAIPAADGVIFIGVPRTARSTDGENLFNIAEIQENGTTFAMRVTPKMRKFWFGVLFKNSAPEPGAGPGAGSGNGIVIIHIPPRPFVTPVLQEESAKIGERMLSRIAGFLMAKRFEKT